MPKFSSSTLAKGARQLVVQEAFEMMLCTSGSYWADDPEVEVIAVNDLGDKATAAHLLKYDSIHGIRNFDLAGQVMTTFFAPASRCFCASSPVLKMPVASTTTSTPSSPQGRFAGSPLSWWESLSFVVNL